jgi:hypothetical protein
MVSHNIALIFDCDETLCDDTTDLVLIKMKQDLAVFWDGVTKLVRKGWDPPLAYMSKFMEVVHKERPGMTTKDLEEVGKQIKFYNGVEDMLKHFQKFVNNDSEYQKAELKLEYYVISGGFESVIRGSNLMHWGVKDVFACNFATGKKGKIIGPKSTVSFTEKTRYLYAINKGIPGDDLRKDPSLVNERREKASRRIPFENMIYLGDGFSDIPCFSMLEQYGGVGVGIFTERAMRRGYELAISRRISAGPYQHNYQKGTDVRLFLEERVRAIAEGILEGRKKELGLESWRSREQEKLESLRIAAEKLGVDLKGIRVDRQLQLGRAIYPSEERKLLMSQVRLKKAAQQSKMRTRI